MGVFRQFPYSNFHEMNMDEIIKIIKNMLEEWATYHAEWDQWMADLEASWSEYQDDVNAQWAAYQNTMNTAWQSMQNFINNYFDNLDVQEEINNKIVSMIQTGEFGLLVNEYIPPAVNAWLNLNITEPEGVVIDTSLSVSGACADAKATGDAINKVKSDLIGLENADKVQLNGEFNRGSYGNYVEGEPVTQYDNNPTNQVKSTTPIDAIEEMNITIASGFEAKIIYVDSDNLYLDRTGWVSAGVIIEKGSRFYIGIKRATEITETADINLFVSKITYTPKIVLDIYEKLDEPQTATLFSEVVKYNKNIYDPKKAVHNYRFRQADGGYYAITGFDVYTVAIPSGKMAVVSCIYNGGLTRQYVRSCRFLMVLDGDGNYIENSTSDTGSSVYSNTTNDTVYAYFTLYNSENATVTTEDYMIELFDVGTPTSEYITPYVPYGFELKITNEVMVESDFFVSPRVASYFTDEVDDTVNKVLEKTTKPSLVIAFVTDTHNKPDDPTTVRQTAETFANLKAVSERIPLTGIVHGGDYVRAGWTHTTQEEVDVYLNEIRMKMVDTNKKVYAINGNHDGINGAPPADNLYNAILSHNEEYVVRENDNPYFYADNDKTKVRMIFISTPLRGDYGMPAVEYNWVKSALDTVPSGYNVMLFTHIDTSCSDFTTNRDNLCNLLNSWHNHTGDYTTNTGSIIAMVAGHRHFDWTVPTSESGLDFPTVVCTCSYCGYITPTADEVSKGAVNVIPRTNKTVTQDSWSILIYRPDESKLYLVRFGAGNDREIDLANWSTT